MDISSTRLTSLLTEALTPQVVPSPKADPATAALVKALVQPPAPSMAQSVQVAAQALNGSLQKPAPNLTQRLSSGEIEDAYRAVMEPEAGMDDPPARSPAGRPVDDDQASRHAAPARQPIADSTARVAPTLPQSSYSPAVATATLVAANANAQQPRGVSARPAGHAPRSEPQPTSLWTISIVTAVVSAATTTIMLFLLR